MEIEEYAGILHCDKEDYYIIKQIGEGATCFVYLCLSKDNQEFALKLYTSQDAYVNEIECLNIIQSCKTIVKLICYGQGSIERGGSLEAFDITNNFETEAINYGLFEYIANGELFDYIFLPKQGFNEDISKVIFSHLIDGVENCHQSGIIHGDIKLENILLSKDFGIKLIDFGFSRVIDKSLLYEWSGTQCYSSPEAQNADSNGYDGIKNDIFSLGVVLFILTVGHMPFDNPTFSDSYYILIIKGEMETFWKKEKADHLSENFKDLVKKLICFDPRERLSMNEIICHPWMTASSDITVSDDLFRKEMASRKQFIDTIRKNKDR